MGRLTLLHPDHIEFPPPSQALDDPPGLLAVGGDLRPERLLAAYDNGIFPWYQDDDGQHSPILWWSPDPRMVLTPQSVHVSRSLQRLIRRQHYRISMDTAFAQVIEQCAATRAQREGTWINPAMQQAYKKLHELGHAHSVEVWENNTLVGGLYGISRGRLFFGESMFSLRTDASKLAFVALCRQLEAWHFTLIDCQLPTPHLASLGAAPISRSEFCQLLERNCMNANQPGTWTYSVKLQ